MVPARNRNSRSYGIGASRPFAHPIPGMAKVWRSTAASSKEAAHPYLAANSKCRFTARAPSSLHVSPLCSMSTMRDTTMADKIGRNRPFMEENVVMIPSHPALSGLRVKELLTEMEAQRISTPKNNTIIESTRRRRSLKNSSAATSITGDPPFPSAPGKSVPGFSFAPRSESRRSPPGRGCGSPPPPAGLPCPGG